ncbi:hypothetical protein ACF8EF_06250 [Pseudomonas sp. zjy_15]|uniref:hypothetical protein n=1 Tax=unclassified Pseudomonas TaxID=196821 RepID=UPI000E6AC7C7
MAMLVFDGSEDSVVEARILVEALNEWLAEQQPSCPLRSVHVQFCYRLDGTLDSVLTVITDVAVD